MEQEELVSRLQAYAVSILYGLTAETDLPLELQNTARLAVSKYCRKALRDMTKGELELWLKDPELWVRPLVEQGFRGYLHYRKVKVPVLGVKQS